MLFRTEELEFSLAASKTFDFKVENEFNSRGEVANEILVLLGLLKAD
ncbi:MAG: hypothetical protein HKL80_09370 [Acidimicrobiales bacterium]|nr:hypothetical protein [Acidimicrobiales bacterium]